jgi:hypothetical protein
MPIQRQSWKMNCRGVNLAAPIDQLPPGDYPRIENVRVIQQGAIEARPGQLQVNTTALGGLIHSIRRLNNPLTGDWTLFTGSGSNLLSGKTDQTVIDTGYSGNPLSLVRFRPDQSPESWMYVADTLKMTKVNVAGTVRGIGVAPPKKAPVTEVVSSLFVTADYFNTASSWTPTGGASSVTDIDRVPGGTSIAYTVQDLEPAALGWFTAAPNDSGADTSWLQPGCYLKFTDGGTNEIACVTQVLPAIKNNTILGIAYDTGTTGYCTIVFEIAAEGIERNSLVKLGPAGPPQEPIRVLSTSISPDGLYSIRTYTVGTYAVGTAVGGLVSFRARTNHVYPVGSTINGPTVNFNVTSSGAQTVGRIQKTVSLDLSALFDRPTQPDDYIHISLKADNPANLLYGRILLDVDATANNFTQNFYQKYFTPSDFQGAANGQLNLVDSTQSALQAALIQSSGVAYVGGDIYTSPVDGAYTNQASGDTPTTSQLTSGSNTWTELIFRVSDLQRVGGDTNQNLSDIKALAIELTVAGNINFSVAGWWFGGGYGPDVVPGTPNGLVYRFRYRDSRTGAKSIPGPATRYGLFPLRQMVYVAVTASADPQVDTIDIERLDPAVQDGEKVRWSYVGSIINANVTFADTLTPAYVQQNQPLEINTIMPWPVVVAPKAGVVNVVGSTVDWVSGDQFLLNYVGGTVIKIDGVDYQLQGTPSSATRIQLSGSANVGTNLPYQISSPLTYGQPLPVMFGPLEGSSASFVFGLGDPFNPGYLYWTNPDDPDSASDKNYIEVTPPSEPLVAGCVWNSFVIVASRDRLFMIQPELQQVNQFVATQLPAASGVWGRWAMTAGIDGIYYLGRDGIYQASPYYGGKLISQDLRPLFPHEGQAGTVTNGFSPVNMNVEPVLRIAVADSEVYFDYQDSTGSARTFKSAPTAQGAGVQAQDVKGWFPYVYKSAVGLHYWEECPDGVTPRLLQCDYAGSIQSSSSNGDNGSPINCIVQLPPLNGEDTRSQKLYVDAITDMEGAATLTLTADWTETNISVSLLAPSQRTQVITNIDNVGNLALYRNLTATYTFPSGTKLYEFQPSFYLQPYLATSLTCQYTDHGIPGWKQVRYARFALIGSSPVTLVVNTSEGGQFSYTLQPGLISSRSTLISSPHKKGVCSPTISRVLPPSLFSPTRPTSV